MGTLNLGFTTPDSLLAVAYQSVSKADVPHADDINQKCLQVALQVASYGKRDARSQDVAPSCCGHLITGKFCTECGKPAGQNICCGLHLNGKFCSECGKPAGQRPSSPSPTSAEALLQSLTQPTGGDEHILQQLHTALQPFQPSNAVNDTPSASATPQASSTNPMALLTQLVEAFQLPKAPATRDKEIGAQLNLRSPYLHEWPQHWLRLYSNAEGTLLEEKKSVFLAKMRNEVTTPKEWQRHQVEHSPQAG